MRETPQDADSLSHRLMLKAGMIKQMASGIYTYLPITKLVLNNIDGDFRFITEGETVRHQSKVIMTTVASSAEDLRAFIGVLQVKGKEQFQLLNCDKQFESGVLAFSVQNEIEVAHFNKHINGNLTAAYSTYGMPITAVEFRKWKRSMKSWMRSKNDWVVIGRQCGITMNLMPTMPHRRTASR